jgi:acyl transferase domain-containing protein
MYVRLGSFVEGIAEFDAAPFRLGPADTLGLDPQSRILLEQTGEVLGSKPGGLSGETLAGTGVYIGCMYTEYLDTVLEPAGIADSASQAIVGHGLSFLVGRISFTFGFQGPCVSTDTACSSSLVALHLAHQV